MTYFVLVCFFSLKLQLLALHCRRLREFPISFCGPVSEIDFRLNFESFSFVSMQLTFGAGGSTGSTDILPERVLRSIPDDVFLKDTEKITKTRGRNYADVG